MTICRVVPYKWQVTTYDGSDADLFRLQSKKGHPCIYMFGELRFLYVILCKVNTRYIQINRNYTYKKAGIILVISLFRLTRIFFEKSQKNILIAYKCIRYSVVLVFFIDKVLLPTSCHAFLTISLSMVVVPGLYKSLKSLVWSRILMANLMLFLSVLDAPR